jgi:putative peptidoglycan lipid II flippase
VIRQFGSFLPTGQLTWYYNATRLQEFALGVFAVSVSVAALPTLSEHAARSDWSALQTTFRRALRVTNFITVPTMAGLFVVAGPVVAVLFRHGQFTAADASVTGELLQILVLALVPIGAIRVTVPTFYALGDTRTPVVAASGSLLTTFTVGLSAVERYEIWGLSAAISVAAVVQLLVLWLLLNRTLRARGATVRRPAGEASVGVHALRCALAVGPSTGIAYASVGLYDWSGGSNIVGVMILGVVAAVAGGAYLLLARLLKIEEAGLFIQLVRRRILRRR